MYARMCSHPGIHNEEGIVVHSIVVEEKVDVALPDFPSAPNLENLQMASTRIHIWTAVCIDQRLLISDHLRLSSHRVPNAL